MDSFGDPESLWVRVAHRREADHIGPAFKNMTSRVLVEPPSIGYRPCGRQPVDIYDVDVMPRCFRHTGYRQEADWKVGCSPWPQQREGRRRDKCDSHLTTSDSARQLKRLR